MCNSKACTFIRGDGPSGSSVAAELEMGGGIFIITIFSEKEFINFWKF
jgi:hypothetical protein